MQVFRSKGFLWLAGENDLYGDWSQAGSILQINAAAPWFAAIPEEAWEAQVTALGSLESRSLLSELSSQACPSVFFKSMIAQARREMTDEDNRLS